MGGPAILPQQGVGQAKYLAPFKLLSIPVSHACREFPGNMATFQRFLRAECLLGLSCPSHMEPYKKVNVNWDFACFVLFETQSHHVAQAILKLNGSPPALALHVL